MTVFAFIVIQLLAAGIGFSLAAILDYILDMEVEWVE